MLTVGSSEKSCLTVANLGCPIRRQIDHVYFAMLRKMRSPSTHMMKVSTRYLAAQGVNFTDRTKKYRSTPTAATPPHLLLFVPRC